MEDVSYIGTKIARIGNVLKRTAASRIDDYQKRLINANSVYGQILISLVIDKFDKKDACRTASEFFGKDIIKFAAIDGTEYSQALYDMIVFY